MVVLREGWGGGGRVQEADQREVSEGYCAQRFTLFSSMAEEREAETKGAVF